MDGQTRRSRSRKFDPGIGKRDRRRKGWKNDGRKIDGLLIFLEDDDLLGNGRFVRDIPFLKRFEANRTRSGGGENVALNGRRTAEHAIGDWQAGTGARVQRDWLSIE